VNDAFGRPDSVLVLGGTSDIALALAARLVDDGCADVVLAGRDPGGLERAAESLLQAGAKSVSTLVFDATEVRAAAGVVDEGFAALGQVDLVVIALGALYDTEGDERDPALVARCVSVNFTWPATALARIAARLADQGTGNVVVLSSVAGVRVRRSNFVYGSAKAGLDAFARAMHQALQGTGARVVVVRPGFVKTKMTEGRTPKPLSTNASAVAADIVRGLETGAEVVWSPRILRIVFVALSLVPEGLWRRLPM